MGLILGAIVGAILGASLGANEYSIVTHSVDDDSDEFNPLHLTKHLP